MTTVQKRFEQAIACYLAKKNILELDRSDMADFCGVSPQAVGQWINGATKSLNGLQNSLAAEYLGVNPDWLAGNPKYNMLDRTAQDGISKINAWSDKSEVNLDVYAIIPRLDVTFMGGSGFEAEQEPEEHALGNAFRRDWLKAKKLREKDLRVVHFDGESFLPFILPGSSVLINLRYNSLENIVEGKVYAIRYGKLLKLKKLTFTLNGSLNLINGSDEVEEVIPPSDFEHIAVIGRYVAHSSDSEL